MHACKQPTKSESFKKEYILVLVLREAEEEQMTMAMVMVMAMTMVDNNADDVDGNAVSDDMKIYGGGNLIPLKIERSEICAILKYEFLCETTTSETARNINNVFRSNVATQQRASHWFGKIPSGR
uniref:HTH_48 domain-containing protein n=1 Tax=Glossina pallidipes TaxID=7398 RepID=A0A1A9ZJE8_GLOPL